jgi:uncharacterized membrane protein
MTNPSSGTGLKENVAALLCYVLAWFTGIIFYFIENKNDVIRFHAAQSIVVFGPIFIVDMIFGWIPFIGWAVATILGVIAFILWVLLMYKAYQGGIYRLPIAAPYADKLDQWLKKNFKS